MFYRHFQLVNVATCMSINDVIIQVRFESIGLKNQYKASKNAFVLEYLNTEMLYSLLNIDKKKIR